MFQSIDEYFSEHLQHIYGNTSAHQVYGTGVTFEDLSLDEINALNIDWLKGLSETEHQNRIPVLQKQKRFMTWVMDLPHTLTVRPQDLVYIDQTKSESGCWIFVLFSSAQYVTMDLKNQHALKSLLVGVNEVFYERCGVATVDLAYPSNMVTFGKLVKGKMPALVFKDSHTFRKMLNTVVLLASEALKNLIHRDTY